MATQNMPPAEVDVTAALVRALLGEQHPDLAGLRVVAGAHGWDNVTYRLGDGLAVRLPRRALAARLVEHEQRVLPVLADRLPIPIPAPVRTGRPGLGYPWPWSVVGWFDGDAAAGGQRHDGRDRSRPVHHAGHLTVASWRGLSVVAPGPRGVAHPSARLREPSPLAVHSLAALNGCGSAWLHSVVVDDWRDDMAMPAATGLTIADIERLPDDMVIRHLIAGELFEVTPPTIRHQQVVMNIIVTLLGWGREAGAQVLTAPTGVRLSDRDMPEPDVLVVTAQHLGRLGERYVEGPPDLVVEVSSPSTRRLDLVRKRRQYERFGVAEFWFVDLDADRVEVYRLGDGGYGSPAIHERGETVTSQALDGFETTIDALLNE